MAFFRAPTLSSTPPPTLLPHQALLRDTPLIPVELLYGQPLATDPQLSPDGERDFEFSFCLFWKQGEKKPTLVKTQKSSLFLLPFPFPSNEQTETGAWLSYLAPSPPNNTLNVFLVPLRNATANDKDPAPPPPKAFQLTKETTFDVDPGQYQWSPDSRFILYLFDRDPKVGDRYRLWRKDVSRPAEEAVDLLPEFSTTKRSALAARNRTESEGAPLPPSNRTLPPGLQGDNLHIGQFFLSEKVPVREVERGGGRERA